jgi:hypothetical protein
MTEQTSKLHKGIRYFATRADAVEHAQAHGFPTGRIIEYRRGWTIQLRVSGPYVGTDTELLGVPHVTTSTQDCSISSTFLPTD